MSGLKLSTVFSNLAKTLINLKMLINFKKSILITLTPKLSSSFFQ